MHLKFVFGIFDDLMNLNQPTYFFNWIFFLKFKITINNKINIFIKQIIEIIKKYFKKYIKILRYKKIIIKNILWGTHAFVTLQNKNLLTTKEHLKLNHKK